jgi:hypothetical protein
MSLEDALFFANTALSKTPVQLLLINMVMLAGS